MNNLCFEGRGFPLELPIAKRSALSSSFQSHRATLTMYLLERTADGAICKTQRVNIHASFKLDGPL